MSDGERVVPLHPVPEIGPEERAHRLQVEVERLAQLPMAEWMLYVIGTEGYAERYGVDKVTLKQMVERVIKENKQRQRADQVEKRRVEDRAKKQREVVKREKERKDERREQQEKKDAEKKDRERQAGLDVIAKLPRGEHETGLRQLARRLGEDVEALRAELEVLLTDKEEATRRAAGEPWPEPVNTKELLDESLALLRDYFVIHDDAAATIYALSVPFAWIHDEIAAHSPLLVIQAADSDVAKTNLTKALLQLMPRSRMIVQPTGPALYRLIDHHHPTLGIDNGDKLLAHDHDLADIVNSSWTRGILIPRTVDKAIHEFDPFCFKIINGVDLLPHLDPATRTRCITTEMRPKLTGETVINFKHAAKDERFATLRRKAMRWTTDNKAAIENAEPTMPEGFHNRLAENYVLLFAIADLAGSPWSEKVRTAAVKLSREFNMPSMGRRLLAIFHDLASRHGPLLTSSGIEQVLPAYGNEWANYKGSGRPITKWQVAELLAPFKIYPDVIHPRGRSADRGYDTRWPKFEIAFRHYLGKETPAGCTLVRKEKK